MPRLALLTIISMASVLGIGLSSVSSANDPQGSTAVVRSTIPDPAKGPRTPRQREVTVSVIASDPNGNALTYQWRSTDGKIVNKNASTTSWTLPNGPGIHFAYVLVSNGKGGYTERRIAINTDSLGTPVAQKMPVHLIPPQAPASANVPFRTWLGGGIGSYVLGNANKQFKVTLPDVHVDAITLTGPIVAEEADTRLQGDLTLHHFEPQPLENIGRQCMIQGIDIFDCFGLDAAFNPVPDEVIDVEANQTNRVDLVPTDFRVVDWITGSVRLEDGSPCGTENEFFGVSSSATVELTDISGVTIPGSQVRANSWGQFSIARRQPVHVNVVVRCEGAIPVIPTASGMTIPASTPGSTSPSTDIGVVTIPGVRAPIVTAMTATPLTGVFDQPVPGLPSDVVPTRPPKFLAMKGLDTRLSACLYYKTVGAVQDCDAEGNFQGAVINFDDWKRTVQIDQFVLPGTRQDNAFFVNLADLNLTRDHHMVSYGKGATTAGYVCNHTGPKSTAPNDPENLFADQAAIDAAIDNAAAGKNLVACVAMDFSKASGVNDDNPFTRFLIFGPSGELLPSVNLDALGEKFVPGTCTVCHGGNKYAGQFPTDGTGSAELEAHFLPFDTANFGFHSSRTGLTKTDQQENIFNLNQDVLNTNTNDATVGLINGWYASGAHVQDEGFIPEDITVQANREFYINVIARSCRTCHIAQRDELSIRSLNFSDQAVNLGKPGVLSPSILKELVCGETMDLVRAYTMPNSKVTFDRFWLSKGSANDQVQRLSNRINSVCINPNAVPSH
jgi:hypothetical protein